MFSKKMYVLNILIDNLNWGKNKILVNYINKNEFLSKNIDKAKINNVVWWYNENYMFKLNKKQRKYWQNRLH